MKVLLFMVLSLVSVSACAGDLAPIEPAFDLIAVITALLGDKAAAVIVVVSVIGYTWAQVRQLVSPEWLAKLPAWVIWLLELLAANKGKAKAAPENDPAVIK